MDCVMEYEKSFKDSQSNKENLPQVFIPTKIVGKIIPELKMCTSSTAKLTAYIYGNV